MIIVDVETSGVDPYKNSLLSVGAVDFERPEREFYGECRVWPGAHIEEDALAINGFTESEVQDGAKKTDRELLLDFMEWAKESSEKTIAGQNVSFDRDFLQATAGRYHVDWNFAKRTIDLHSVAYFHIKRAGKSVPLKNGHSGLNLDAILAYAGLPGEPKPHNGLMGAKLEAEAFSRLFNDRPMFPEWSKYPIPWL